jgi:hypothetical protein
MSKKVSIKNRSNSIVIYNIPEMGIRREFMPNEVKNITSDELEALSYRPGGMDLIRNELLITDAEVLTDMAVKVEPEYYLDDKGVIELLNTGSMDSFLDCLDFAPQGVLDLIKKYAVSLPVNDSRKREAIKTKLGLDVDLALLHQKQVKEALEEESGKTERLDAPVRRVKTEEKPAGRRTAIPQYKVVSKQGE